MSAPISLSDVRAVRRLVLPSLAPGLTLTAYSWAGRDCHESFLLTLPCCEWRNPWHFPEGHGETLLMKKKKKETCKLMAPFSAQLNVTPKVPVNNNNIHHGELLSKGSPTGPAELPF